MADYQANTVPRMGKRVCLAQSRVELARKLR
jgi:hypothetical protein